MYLMPARSQPPHVVLGNPTMSKRNTNMVSVSMILNIVEWEGQLSSCLNYRYSKYVLYKGLSSCPNCRYNKYAWSLQAWISSLSMTASGTYVKNEWINVYKLIIYKITMWHLCWHLLRVLRKIIELFSASKIPHVSEFWNTYVQGGNVIIPGTR